VPLRPEPVLKTERILTVDFTSTEAQAKELVPPASQGEAQAEAAKVIPSSASSPPSTDGVDRMYHQLA
jgi:hypothetical protein